MNQRKQILIWLSTCTIIKYQNTLKCKFWNVQSYGELMIYQLFINQTFWERDENLATGVKR
ncbi:hypothetical protein KKC1_25510 [Calderihabitans maritimus]|uniref:Uncharacterized protein n=1 Tax=Calderihabitans maritimus TaxID=1246530 RepID=A0A1Z5HVP8_9FIRM|nr:hypothetical protein KKC1_25510 [Calderihabitans maritimus]